MSGKIQPPEGLREIAREAAALPPCRHWLDVGETKTCVDCIADAVLAALFAACEVREEWGCRLTVPDGHIPDCWREHREAAEAMADWHIRNRSIATPTLIRRLHLTLPAEAATEPVSSTGEEETNG